MYVTLSHRRHGWSFLREESFESGGRDLGEIEAFYRKGEFVAYVFYAGAPSTQGNSNGHDFTYTLGLTWGIH